MACRNVNINWNLVNELLEAGCSGVEIASKIGINENTLYNRCKTDLNMEFEALKQQKRSKGDALLKKVQFDMAVIDKDKSMLIWLGKNRLGQKDKLPNDLKEKKEQEIDYSVYSDEELNIMIKLLEKGTIRNNVS